MSGSMSWLAGKASLIIDIISFLYIILFLYTGISKFLEFPIFKVFLSDVPVLKPFAPFIAWFIPTLEILLSIGLFIDRFRKINMYLSVLLMILFTVYIAGLMLFSPQLPCSCGGIIAALSWPAHLVFNSSFIALGVWAIYLLKKI